MNQILQKVNPRQPRYDIVTNCNAAVLNDINQLQHLLTKQISSPVLFNETN